jgi:NADH:ubiquinone oxidoreductase subunit H
LILLTEYANIIGMSFWMIILFSVFPLSLLLVLYFVCLIRSTLNRLKFDELMTNAWIVLLPILFYILSFQFMFLVFFALLVIMVICL